MVEELKSETSGNLEKLLKAMMTPLPQFYAKELREAMKGVGTDETILIEIMCALPNFMLESIKEAYEESKKIFFN